MVKHTIQVQVQNAEDLIHGNERLEEMVKLLVDEVAKICIMENELRLALASVVHGAFVEGYREGIKMVMEELKAKGYIRVH